MDPYVSKATFAYATERQPSHFRVTSHDELDIVRIEKAVTYEEFFVKYLLRNVPCILSSSFTDEWKCRQEWMDDNNEINTEFLSKKFGDVIVPIADCDTHQYNAQVKSDMLFKQFLEWWKARSKNQKSPNDKEKNLYLKDWHFPKLFNEYEAYVTPDYFSSDWLNEFFDDLEDDYRFLYMGPKGSWTPFHADVYKSNSWSANVCGKKRWHLFPPGYESHFKDLNENLAYSIFSPELEDQRKYPTYSKLKLKRGFEVTQCSGEIIFVPSGWYHEVYNIEDTISINHNWFNACNIDFVWEALQQGLLNVEKEISDCSDADTFTEDCQMILSANHGMNYEMFSEILTKITNQRMKSLKEINSDGNCHGLFDLKRAKDVLKNFLHSIESKDLKLNFYDDLLRLISTIDKILKHYI